MLPVRCAICDAKCSAEGVVACQRCKSARFCGKACEAAGAHRERCAVICSLPAASEQQKKMVRAVCMRAAPALLQDCAFDAPPGRLLPMAQMLSDYVLADDTLGLFRANNWLGDENIEFFWEQIAKELTPADVVSDILFVPPTVMMSVPPHTHACRPAENTRGRQTCKQAHGDVRSRCTGMCAQTLHARTRLQTCVRADRLAHMMTAEQLRDDGDFGLPTAAPPPNCVCG